MKKFLTKEESQRLINEYGFNPVYASYIEKHDSRFDTTTMSMLEYFSIALKTDCDSLCYDSKTGEFIPTHNNKTWKDEDSIFSVGDIIFIIEEIYERQTNDVLEEMKWNYLSYEWEDNNELIDILYNWIIKH